MNALDQAKAARNAAHADYRQRLEQVNDDLAARGIGGRIADRAGQALSGAAEIAGENKGVIAGTLAALVLWLLRGPIIGLIERLWTDHVESADVERIAEDD